MTTENQEYIEDAKRAYELGCQEREILIDLSQDAYDSGLTQNQFEEILKQAGYPSPTAKAEAKDYWQMAADAREEDEEEEE